MKRDVKLQKNGGVIAAGVRVIDHPAATWLDSWLDEDGNGRPDKYRSRVKAPNDRENQVIDIGDPSALLGTILQWVWMPSQPPNSVDDWVIELHLKQNGVSLEGFPLKLTGKYPDGKKYGLFETWCRFTEAV